MKYKSRKTRKRALIRRRVVIAPAAPGRGFATRMAAPGMQLGSGFGESALGHGFGMSVPDINIAAMVAMLGLGRGRGMR